jgi:hypothetical protein
MTRRQAQELVDTMTRELELPHIPVTTSRRGVLPSVVYSHAALNVKKRTLFITPDTLADPAAPLVLAHEVAHAVQHYGEQANVVLYLLLHALDPQSVEREADTEGVALLRRVGHPLPTFEEVEPFLMQTLGMERAVAFSKMLRKERAA